MIAVLDDSDIDIDNVPAFQQPLTRYPVAYLMIHRSADGLGKSLVVEGSGYRLLLVDNVIVADAVQFAGRDPGHSVALGAAPVNAVSVTVIVRAGDAI